jgi:uncharacterized SAM-binding protein YcdF (DUF218 family)
MGKHMFLLKKFVTPFLLPPGIFILALIISGALLIFWNRRKIGAYNLAIGILFWIFCTSPFSNLLMRGLESEFHIPKNVNGDVLLLLGGGIIDKVPDFSGYGIPTDRMIGRIVTAVRLQKKMDIPIIVSGGKSNLSNSSEALIVKRFLIDLGVKEDQIKIDEKSRDTIENAKHIREICLRNDYKNPILITSASHMKRSVLSFKKVGIDVMPYPANFKSADINDYGWLNYLPRASSLGRTSAAFREYLGILFYRLVY